MTDGGSRQWKQTEQLKTIVAPIGIRLTLGKLVLHRYSHIQNQMVREFSGVAGNHDVVNGREFHSKKFAARINGEPAFAAPWFLKANLSTNLH